MVDEAEASFVRRVSASLICPSFTCDSCVNVTHAKEGTTIPSVVGEDQESSSMGDILSDIFSSQFAHANLAATSPQDLFGILDFLETPQETSRFIGLIEENNTTSNGNGDVDNELAKASDLKLPVLEQEEPEIEAYPNISASPTLHFNVDHHGSSRNMFVQSSKSTSGTLCTASLMQDSNKCRLKSEACGALLRKSMSFQLKEESLETFSDSETETDTLDKRKKKRLKGTAAITDQLDGDGDGDGEGDGPRMTHIAVERNRRKQMNEHLSVLRSLMPGFYVQRGDQASIIGGVIEFIKELQQVLQSLESKKQRKAYSEVVSPSPKPTPASTPTPTPTPSPRGLMGLGISLPISPRTPQATASPLPLIRAKSTTAFMEPNFESVKELVANSKSSVADVEVKIAGSNALLKTLSHKIPGQILKLVQTLEKLSLEILHLNVSTIDDTVLNSFTLKIGIECKLSVEELAQAVQQTFSA